MLVQTSIYKRNSFVKYVINKFIILQVCCYTFFLSVYAFSLMEKVSLVYYLVVIYIIYYCKFHVGKYLCNY